MTGEQNRVPWWPSAVPPLGAVILGRPTGPPEIDNPDWEFDRKNLVAAPPASR
jgi:hypothetical protein